MTVVAAAVLSGGYWWWSGRQSGDGAVQYVTALVEKGTMTMSVSGSGNVVVDQLATVDPTISGTVTALSVRVGDAVTKGQLLFVIENDQLDVALGNASVSLKRAENAVFSANISKDQARDAYETRTGSALNKNILKQKIESARVGISLAEDDLRVARLSYQKALDDAGKRRVTSPIDGTINEINIKNGDDLGSNASSGGKVTPIIVGDLSTVKAVVSVNEVDIPNVEVGQKAVLSVDALGGVEITGKIEKIDALGTVSQGVVNYNVTIDFDTPNEKIKPDMSVTASIVADVRQDVLMVPNSAVKSSDGTSYVEVLNDEGGTPERVAVEVGIVNATHTEIIGGVRVGDNVVTQTVDPNASLTSSSASSGGFRIPGLGGGRRE